MHKASRYAEQIPAMPVLEFLAPCYPLYCLEEVREWPGPASHDIEIMKPSEELVNDLHFSIMHPSANHLHSTRMLGWRLFR